MAFRGIGFFNQEYVQDSHSRYYGNGFRAISSQNPP